MTDPGSKLPKTGLDPASLFDAVEAPTPTRRPDPASGAQTTTTLRAVAQAAQATAAAPAGGKGGPADGGLAEAHTLEDWLKVLAGADSLPLIEGGARADLREGAIAALASGPPSEDGLRRLSTLPELLAASAALKFRAERLFVFWQPLLQLCREARTTAPVADLESLVSQGRALLDALGKGPGGPGTDRATELVRGLVERSTASLPTDAARTSLHREDRERAAATAAAKLKETTRVKPAESRMGSVPARLLVLGGLLALVLAGSWMMGGGSSGAGSFDRGLRSRLPELVALRVYGKTLEVEVSNSWAQKSRTQQELDARSVFDIPGRPPFDRVGIRAGTTWILSIEADGSVQWIDPPSSK